MPTGLGEALWIYPTASDEECERVVQDFCIHPVVARILVQRGFTSRDDIHQFLYAKLPQLHDPHMMGDMGDAVARVMRAIETGENILIYGDNDVDGMTGTALLTEFLRSVGATVYFYVPNRTKLTQSIIIDALRYALDHQCSLLITVDCGITAAKEIKEVAEHQVDVIITDHHEPTAKIPHCVATLNPKVINNTYPNRDLTGVGVAFKLAHAVANELITTGKLSRKKVDLKKHLDLVAMGTVADMGSLRGENRILTRYGIQKLRGTSRVGVTKLCEISEVNRSDIDGTLISSKIAPRLNSLGRVADPRKGVELLLAKSSKKAEALARELEAFNTLRQQVERMMADDVEEQLQKNPQILDESAIVMFSEKWHPGIVAIITARIAKQYNRPTAMISVDGDVGKASLRTIPEFPLLEPLSECRDLLLNYGGHDFASGLTIKKDNIPEFRQRFIACAEEKLKPTDLVSKLKLDAEVSFDRLTFEFLESLALLEPHGNDNPPPVLYADCRQAWPPKVIGENHLKLYLEQNDRMLEGIAFGMADRAAGLRKRNLVLRVAFYPQVNTFQGKSSIQLLVRDFKVVSQNF